MEKDYKIVKVGYEDIRIGFESTPLTGLKLEHMMIPLPVIYGADLIVYVSPCREIKLLKNRHGAVGIINNFTQKESEVVKIPTPNKNENRSDFVSRCIPIVIEDGTAADSDQAVAICSSIYDESKKSVYKGAIFPPRKG